MNLLRMTQLIFDSEFLLGCRPGTLAFEEFLMFWLIFNVFLGSVHPRSISALPRLRVVF